MNTLLLASALLAATPAAPSQPPPAEPASTAATPAVPTVGPDSWAFVGADDDFSQPDALGLRALLNEPVAGAAGFVRLSADGNSFVGGDGRPIRFWGVVSDGHQLSPPDMERHAAWLAKRGVNLVRIHANLSVPEEGAQITDVNTKVLDGILRWVATCKRHGIYTVISPFWAWPPCPKSWGIAGYSGQQPWGVLFFNPRMQEAYRTWVRALYTTPNPYADGVPLKDETAVAIVQVKNEDSLLFWTFDRIEPEQKKLLGQRWAAWVQSRHGSLEKALQSWEGAGAQGDDLGAAVLGFRPTADLTSYAQKHPPGLARRLAEQLEFLVSVQRGFYADMGRFYREELGVRQLTNAMNWRSADAVLLDDAERYSYTAMDVSAVNYYTSGLHVGENNGYRIDPGHKITHGSVLRGTAPFPSALKQTVGHPMLITETAWVNPNLYQSEGPFLNTAYQSLSGVDITCWFTYPGPTGPEWTNDNLASIWPVGDSFAAWKWYGSHPMQAGQFPALSLAFRRGYITAASEPAVHEERTLESIWSGKVPIISESGRFDPNRDSGSFTPDSPVRQEVDRAAFFVGPVQVTFGGNPARTRTVDLSRYIDAKTGDVRSLTGELLVNTRRGLATIDAARAQGVAGFLSSAGGEFRLSSTRWSSSNEYAALIAVSLDGEPLASSRRILVQAGTTCRMGGFRTRPVLVEEEGRKEMGEEILHSGEPPWRVACTRATLALRNPSISRGTALDANLRPTGEVSVRREGDEAVVRLPEHALYLVLE